MALGLLCFGLWFLVDATQLYDNALAAPLGTRRTVSIELLRPFVRVEGLLHIGGLTNSADRLLGRTGTTGSVGPIVKIDVPVPAVSLSTGPGPVDFLSNALEGRPLDVVDPPPAVVPLVALKNASRAHPLTVLSVGDSLGADLGIGLGDVLGSNANVRVIQAAKVDTGLADLAYYNWSVELPRLLATYHPEIVVMMLGANDWQPFKASNGKQAYPGTPLWHQRYGARVATIMREVRLSGAHLVWVGLPIFGAQIPFPTSMSLTINGVFRHEVRVHPGVLFCSTYRLFMNPEHQFSEYLTGPSGTLEMVRSGDGVHFTEPYGVDELGADVVKFIDDRLHLSLVTP